MEEPLADPSGPESSGPGNVVPPPPSPAVRGGWARLLAIATLVGLIALGIFSAVRYTIWSEYHYRAAEKALALRHLDEARAHIAVCLQTWPASAPTRLLAARISRLSQAYDEAEEHLVFCSRLKGAPVEEIQLEELLMRAQRGDMSSEVEQLLLKHKERDPNAQPLMLEAISAGYRKLYRLREALKVLDMLVEVFGDHGWVWSTRGTLHEQLLDAKKAVADYEKALELDPADDQARERLGFVLLTNVRSIAEALQHFEVLYARHPDKPIIMQGLARCLRDLGQLDAARDLLDRLLKVEPNDAIALAERGRLALELGQYAEAEGFLRRSAALEPYDYQINFVLAQCLSMNGRKAESEKIKVQLEQIQKDNSRMEVLMHHDLMAAPHDADLRYEAAAICVRLGNITEGVRWLQSAVQEDPFHRPSHVALADYYQTVGDLRMAEYHRQRGGVEPK